MPPLVQLFDVWESCKAIEKTLQAITDLSDEFDNEDFDDEEE